MTFVLGIDTGGTFTDCVAIDEAGQIVQDKALTTAEDPARGVFQALANVAARLGLEPAGLLRRSSLVGHGTTVGLNQWATRTGARVGLLTTKGHEDAFLIGRIYQKVAGLGEQEVTHAVRLEKADPIVPRTRIVGLTERVDFRGEVLVPLNLQEAEASVDRLVAQGVEALAVCLLWSFMNPRHEQLVKEMVARRHPGLYVSLSSELVPEIKEYERTATTAINAYLGPTLSRYLESLEAELRGLGLGGPLLMMQSSGGVLPVDEAKDRVVFLLSSGPAGGVIGATIMGRLQGWQNIITTDVGGTSFDVGLVVDGESQISRAPVFGQYHVLTPTIDVTSIGAGGGSIAWVEPESGLLRVGPRSAGALPGPACYGRGGTEPTVTDADLLLGRLNPDGFFGGRMRISPELAERAIRERVAEPMGLDVVEAALGIVEIVDAHLADLVRKVTIGRGFDPRDFVLFAYGGMGPVHVGHYGRDLGVRLAVVSPYAPVFSALGIAASDVARWYYRSDPMVAPGDVSRIGRIFAELEERALADLKGMEAAEKASLHRFVDLMFRKQVHELRVPFPSGVVTAASVEAAIERFQVLYERTYGRGTAYRDAGIEMTTFRVMSIVPAPMPAFARRPVGREDPGRVLKGRRPVCFARDFIDTPVYDLERLEPGHLLVGPAVAEGPATALVLHPGQRAHVDEYANLLIEFE
ncbi:MAG: hydantoinase/oxoprolinase family protein [Deltaproteobacteria bacterium]|nr:hydantoinase/oxoprolinase family protein [Deltaproteobacteria bacterium]